ncbi:MAG: MBL fold metallo-hydrolase [Asgard group archaeon]|nr:MBL fold metallo-hydrolase [Asgard group archaeon]
MSYQTIDLGKGVVMCTKEHNTNIICIELDEGLVFVDSGRQDDIAVEFRKEMEKKFNKKATHLLLTHYHHDHISGMSAFKDIEIIGSKTGNKKYLEDLKSELSLEGRKAAVERWKILAVEQKWEPNESRDLLWKYYGKVELLPTTKATDKIEIGSDKKKIIFKNVGGHTECSAYIYVPHENMVLLGDNFVGDSSSVGGCFFGGLRENIIGILEEVIKLKPKVIVPGHGPTNDLAYANKALDYYKKLFKALDEIFDKGIKEADISTYEGLPEFYDGKPEYLERVLSRLYNAVGSEKTIKKLDKINEKLTKASLENNLDKLLEFYTDDCIITVSNGFYVRGKEDFRNRFRPTTYVDYKYKRTDQYFIGEKFVERIESTSTTEANGEQTTSISEAIHIWVNDNGKWKINMEIRLGEKDNQ